MIQECNVEIDVEKCQNECKDIVLELSKHFEETNKD